MSATGRGISRAGLTTGCVKVGMKVGGGDDDDGGEGDGSDGMTMYRRGNVASATKKGVD